jgi:hypothetical protein
MERPGDVEEIQKVAMLRVLNKTQDEVAKYLKMRKDRIGQIETWLKTRPIDHIESYFLDRLRNVVDELSKIENLTPKELLLADRLTCDQILQHYRDDYVPKPKPPMVKSSVQPLVSSNLYTDQYSKHWAQLCRVAEALEADLRFSPLVGGEYVKSRNGDPILSNWSFSKYQMTDGKYKYAPKIRFNAEESALWSSFIEHMDTDFPGFSTDFNKFKFFAVSILVVLRPIAKGIRPETKRDQPKLRESHINLGLRKTLLQVIDRGTFSLRRCPICKDWN